MSAFWDGRERVLVISQALASPSGSHAATHSHLGLRTSYGLVYTNLSWDCCESRQIIQHPTHSQSLDWCAAWVRASVYQSRHHVSNDVIIARYMIRPEVVLLQCHHQSMHLVFGLSTPNLAG
jgi:hypothetical protein